MASTQLQLPTFANSHCDIFTACGQLKGIDATTQKWLEQLDEMTIKFKADGGTAYLHALYGGHDGTHLHFDVALSKYFGHQAPKVTHKKADVSRVLTRIRGMQIDVSIEASFTIKKDDVENPLFELLTPMTIPIDASDAITVSFTGVELHRSGGDFLDRIRLSVDDDQFRLTCEYQQSSKVSNDYLVEIANRSDTVFESIIRVGTIHEND